ncbi:IS4 family transposase [Telluribacter sp.]|uniref:IS4 family transposase n=1 Tax=Telluribacter sp. TaxID=1978767 RepID=UPI002E13A1F1|nr:IS4 family transposase [Telluribacter sp.]
MQKVDIEDIDLEASGLSALSVFFDSVQLERLGRQVRFIERSTSRLSAWMFLQLNTCLVSNGSSVSLTDMTDTLLETFGVELTKQSLDERFNCFAVTFMRSCFEHVFEQVVASSGGPQSATRVFERVILRDATSFQLPAQLASFYEGNAGDTTGSVIKIQQEYDLLSGKVLRLDLRSGKENDTQWLNEQGLPVSANDLQLMDLGYFKLGHLLHIARQGGYFISRYKVGTSLFRKDRQGHYQKLDWSELLPHVQGADFERQIWLGEGTQKLPVRLHLHEVPDLQVQKRLRKYQLKDCNQPSTRKKYQTSELKKRLASYNIFITNATEQQLEAEQIYTFYKLRWQIELLFKIWKSVFAIDKIGKMSVGRFHCYLYGKLIAILVTGAVQPVHPGQDAGGAQ